MSIFDHRAFTISANDTARLDALYEHFAEHSRNHIGFPANTVYDYRDLHRFFEFTINNVGDPFADGIYKINTHELEREVLAFFARLFHAPMDGYWGHITHGGTEGNMYAIYAARESLPDGVLYASEDAHYSIPKIARVLRIPHVAVASQEQGEMDYDDLYEKIRERPDNPPIVVATIGTTMKGAVDQVEEIAETIRRAGMRKFYIHCDGALGGMVLPFADGAPAFDFRTDTASITVSGHKMIGAPVPCGIVIIRKEYVTKLQRDIELIGSPDTTLSGSRNGHAAIFLWFAIRRFGADGFHKMITHCLDTKRYAVQKLADIGWEAYSGTYSPIIMLTRPSETLVRRWQLAVEGDHAHIVVMPGVSRAHVDAFVADIATEK